LILGHWREHGGVLLAVTLAGILSTASLSASWHEGDQVPALVVLATTCFFLLATLLAHWSQSDTVTLRAAGAPRWLAPLVVVVHVVGIAGGSTLVGLLLRRGLMEGHAWGWDALSLLVAMLLAAIGSIIPAWRLWRVDLSEEIRRR
jgi:hypothetical protein